MKWLKILQDKQGHVIIYKTRSGDFLVQTGNNVANRLMYTCTTLDALCLVLEGRFSREVLVESLA